MKKLKLKVKPSKYEVTLTREVEYRIVIEVDAGNAEEAKQIAESLADAQLIWREGGITSQTAKVKIVK